MKKNIKIFFIFLLTTIILLTTISFPINALSDVNIIQDSSNSTSLPINFLKPTDISKASALKSLNSNFNVKNWFGSPYRGNFNLGWSLSPSLYYLAPTVFNKYYEYASSSKYSDNYIVSPSGNGYIYPSKYPPEKLIDYTKRLNEYMKNVDEHSVLILDDETFYKKDLWDKYTCNSNIDALFYLNYDINNAYKGKIIWSNG